MKTYKERKKETCEWCAKGIAFAFENNRIHLEMTGDMWPNAVRRHQCTVISHEDYEAELRAEIEELKTKNRDAFRRSTKEWLASPAFKTFADLKHSRVGQILVMLQDGQISRGRGCEALAELAHGVAVDDVRLPEACAPVFGDDETPAETYSALRATFARVATVIQGAYLNGQLPPISDAELAEKIITEYGGKQASAYEQGKRADVLEKKLRTLGDLWNKLSGSGSQTWTQEMPTVLFDALDQLCSDLADSPPGIHPACDAEAPTEAYEKLRIQQHPDAKRLDILEAFIRVGFHNGKITKFTRSVGSDLLDIRSAIDGLPASGRDASPQPESAERKEHAGE